MYRHSPLRNQRSKGIKFKHILQVCLLIVVCFWLIYQLKRTHHTKQHFDDKVSSDTHAVEIVNFGRKDLQPKLEQTNDIQTQEQQDEEEKEDEIDETELEKLNMEIDRDIVDEDKETEEKENEEEIDGEIETENVADHDEDGYTHETHGENYKADDASSAVITQNEFRNETLDDNSIENVVVDSDVVPDNATLIQEEASESINATSSIYNGTLLNTALMTSAGDRNATVTEGPSYTIAAEVNSTDPTISANLEENEIGDLLETLREIELEESNSEETAAE